MADGLYVGLLRNPIIRTHIGHHTLQPRHTGALARASRIGRVKRTTATPSVPWRERLRRSIAFAAEDSQPYRIIVHSCEQGYEGLKMLRIFSPDANLRITFVVSKHEPLGKQIVQK